MGSGGGSRFVGQVVDLGGGNKLRVKKVIAEGMSVYIHTHTCTYIYIRTYKCTYIHTHTNTHTGGYGYVFVAQDTRTGKDYALKVLSTCRPRQFGDSGTMDVEKHYRP